MTPKVSKPNVTQLLLELSSGKRESLDQLIPLVYAELRRLADSFMRGERGNHTLQPTALVHEAYLRLIDQREVNWQNRAHFFSIAAETMRRILVNHAHSSQAAKRGGRTVRLSIDEAINFPGVPDVDLVLLDEALDRLASFDAQQSRIVELRFFGGLTIKEVAEITELSTATVEREWRTAKAWLHHQISAKE
jgi:RNA polymerase sigma factor (TIGR02999 family)